MADLCPAGPIAAVEIQVESPSLASTCGVHHAVVRRVQVCHPSWACWGGVSPGQQGQDLGGLWLCVWGLLTLSAAPQQAPGAFTADRLKRCSHLPATTVVRWILHARGWAEATWRGHVLGSGALGSGPGTRCRLVWASMSSPRTQELVASPACGCRGPLGRLPLLHGPRGLLGLGSSSRGRRQAVSWRPRLGAAGPSRTGRPQWQLAAVSDRFP